MKVENVYPKPTETSGQVVYIYTCLDTIYVSTDAPRPLKDREDGFVTSSNTGQYIGLRKPHSAHFCKRLTI